MDGHVDAIRITARAGGPLTSLQRARLQAGVGIEGDRYAIGRGTWSDHPAGDRVGDPVRHA